jgi:hypothetical protein
MTKLEKEFKDKFKKLAKKLNIKEFSIEYVDDDRHYDILDIFVELFNLYTGNFAYILYASIEYKDLNDHMQIILFTNTKIKDEDIEKFTSLILEYEPKLNDDEEKSRDVFNFLSEEYKCKTFSLKN